MSMRFGHLFFGGVPRPGNLQALKVVPVDLRERRVFRAGLVAAVAQPFRRRAPDLPRLSMRGTADRHTQCESDGQAGKCAAYERSSFHSILQLLAFVDLVAAVLCLAFVACCGDRMCPADLLSGSCIILCPKPLEPVCQFCAPYRQELRVWDSFIHLPQRQASDDMPVLSKCLLDPLKNLSLPAIFLRVTEKHATFG